MAEPKPKPARRTAARPKTAFLQEGNTVQIKTKLTIALPEELKAYGVGPFVVARREPQRVYLTGLHDFSLPLFQAVRYFEPCKLKLTT